VPTVGSHFERATELQGVGGEFAAETGALHEDVSGDRRSVEIDNLKACLVVAVGAHEQRAANVEELGVQQAVETGPGHVEVAIDFGALQTHRLGEFSAIGELEIRLVLQTIGRDVVVSPSIRLPAISMGRMSFAFSRSISRQSGRR